MWRMEANGKVLNKNVNILQCKPYRHTDQLASLLNPKSLGDKGSPKAGKLVNK